MSSTSCPTAGNSGPAHLYTCLTHTNIQLHCTYPARQSQPTASSFNYTSHQALPLLSIFLSQRDSRVSTRPFVTYLILCIICQFFCRQLVHRKINKRYLDDERLVNGANELPTIFQRWSQTLERCWVSSTSGEIYGAPLYISSE